MCEPLGVTVSDLQDDNGKNETPRNSRQSNVILLTSMTMTLGELCYLRRMIEPTQRLGLGRRQERSHFRNIV